MGRTRFKDQIPCKILQVCRIGANKTQIVYSCNLNFHTVVPYIELLIKNGLPERLEGENCSLLKTQGGVTAAIAPSGALEMGT